MSLSKETIDYLLEKSSFMGLLTLYFVKIRFDKKEGFNKSDLEKIGSGEYVYGYFIACCSFNLFDYTSNKDVFNITRFDDYLSSSIKKKLVESAEKHDQSNPNDTKWLDDVTRVETI